MRTLIFNGTIIPGDGRTVIPNGSLTIEDHIIASISSVPYPAYARADKKIDAGGGYIIPGIINHHAHGVTPGPFLPFPEPPLSIRDVLHNLDRHLSQGTTTICGTCGFTSIEEVEWINKLHPLNVKTTTLHTPLTFEWAEVMGSDLDQRHRTLTPQEMRDGGAVAVGEAIPVTNISKIERELGIKVSGREIRNLFLAVQKETRPDPSTECLREIGEMLEKMGLGNRLHPAKVVQVIRANRVDPEKLKRCFREQVETAKQLQIPLIAHHTRESSELLLEVAPEMGSRMIAAHSNLHADFSTQLPVLQELKRNGVIIDINTGDAFGAKQATPRADVTFSIMAAGLADLISTDHVWGYWDSILLLLEKAIEARAVDLPRAIAMATGNVIQALPRLAYNRGLLEPGRVADLALLGRERISEVKTILIGGRVVFENGHGTYGSLLPG